MCLDASREDNIAKQSPEVPLEQWIAFVDYRARPTTKAKAIQNTVNRGYLTMTHTLGSKSFAQLENEMESQLGRLVTRAELFQAGHTISDGSFVNDEARQNHVS
ncbi:putative transposase, Ptta/En/Spm, plant [Dioscorea sansibarensis]